MCVFKAADIIKGIIADITNPTPIIKATIAAKPSPNWMLRTAVPSNIITGNASGKEERTPNMAPLLIDKALPKANKLNNKRFDMLSNKNTLAKLSMATPLANENNAPINAMGIPIKQTYTNILESTSL